MAALEVMTAAGNALAGSGLVDQALKVGQTVPFFELPDASGKPVSSRELLAGGPMLLTFYRGGWCPYCNLALRALHAASPQLKALGVQLVAISPQTPDHSLTMQEKEALSFPVLSDRGNRVAREFGILFRLTDELLPIYQDFGIDLMDWNADRSFELPVPASYLVGRDGVVLERYLEVDYQQRLDPEAALGWARRHGAAVTATG